MEPYHLWDVAILLWLALCNLMHRIEHTRLTLVRVIWPMELGGLFVGVVMRMLR
jgi:hypothetical protein